MSGKRLRENLRERCCKNVVFAERGCFEILSSKSKLKKNQSIVNHLFKWTVYFQRKWKLGKDNFFHFTPEVKKSHEPIPSAEFAEQAIEYAKELEMIV